LPRERAAAKLREGKPLLHDEPMTLDLEFAAERFLRLARQLQPSAAAEAIAQAVAGGQLDTGRLLTEAFVQHADHLRQIASASPGLDHELIASLATQAVEPLLRAYAERLAPLVHRLSCWERGYCPVCGGRGVPGAHGGVECAACGCTWAAAEAGPTSFRIELAVPEDDEPW
jgi:hypothetical protein